MRRAQKGVSIPGLVEAMIEAGASFFFSAGGCLFVRGLGDLPTYLRDAFFDCDNRELVRFLRSGITETRTRQNFELSTIQ